MTCETCGDGEYPNYGVAPHECFWKKGPQFTIDQSTLEPLSEWVAPFVPDLEPGETWANFVYPSACGTYYCPECRTGYETAWNAFVAIHGPPPATD